MLYTQEQPIFADVMVELVTQLDLSVEKLGESLIVIPIDLDEQRKQRVWVRPLGMDDNYNLIIGVSSPALNLREFEQETLPPEFSLELLERNASMNHGAWAIERWENDTFLVVIETLIAETMNPEDFRAAIWGVARAADGMEAKFGRDEF